MLKYILLTTLLCSHYLLVETHLYTPVRLKLCPQSDSLFVCKDTQKANESSGIYTICVKCQEFCPCLILPSNANPSIILDTLNLLFKEPINNEADDEHKHHYDDPYENRDEPKDDLPNRDNVDFIQTTTQSTTMSSSAVSVTTTIPVIFISLDSVEQSDVDIHADAEEDEEAHSKNADFWLVMGISLTSVVFLLLIMGVLVFFLFRNCRKAKYLKQIKQNLELDLKQKTESQQQQEQSARTTVATTPSSSQAQNDISFDLRERSTSSAQTIVAESELPNRNVYVDYDENNLMNSSLDHLQYDTQSMDKLPTYNSIFRQLSDHL